MIFDPAIINLARKRKLSGESVVLICENPYSPHRTRLYDNSLDSIKICDNQNY